MKRRVLFLTASYPTPELPGAGIFVREHALAVAPHADVAVVHLDRGAVRGIHIEEVAGEPFPTWRVRYPRSPAPLSYLGNVVAAALAYRRVRRSGFRPDLLHAHFFLAGVPAVLLGKALRKPVVLTEQWSVFLPDDPATLSPLVRRAARFAFEGAQLVLPVSEALRDGIAEVAPEATFRIVPNVFDDELFHPGEAPQGRRLLAVGGMYEAKGWEYLLEAVALLKGEVHLDIVGDGELRGQYEALAGKLGIDGRVTWHGHRPKPEVAELMRAADLFVLTSRYDSNPCVLIEALGSGLPVVATRVGGIPGMVGEGDGLLAEPRDPQSIAGALETALAEPERFDRARIAAAARERYGLEAVGRAFAEAYDEAARLRGGTLPS